MQELAVSVSGERKKDVMINQLDKVWNYMISKQDSIFVGLVKPSVNGVLTVITFRSFLTHNEV